MKAMAHTSAAQSTSPGMMAKNTTCAAAAAMKTVRGPNRSRQRPTTSCPMEPSANTRNASPPSAVGETLMPERRSSKTYGRAKVVDWKTMLETADHDRGYARHEEGDAPAAVVYEVTSDEGGTGDTEVAPHAIDGDAHPRVLPFLDDDGEADGMIYGGEYADHQQPEPDL